MLKSRLLLGSLVAVGAMLGGAPRAASLVDARSAQLGPTVLMFYGGTLKKPILVSASKDVTAFGDLTRRSAITMDELGNRPYLNVALFWGPASNPAINGTPIADLTPDMAWQHGRFYPPAGSQPAMILTTRLTKSAQPVPAPSTGAAFVAGGPLPDTALPVLRKLGLLPAAGGSVPR